MRIATHDGKFHTDEVMAISLLLLIFPGAEVVRTRDPKVLVTCDIVVDVGGVHNPDSGRFDHHQKGGAGEWPDGTKLSSFGLVWKAYGGHLVPHPEVLIAIEQQLVIPVDARDNGQQPERRARDIPSIADFIDALNGAWDETIDENAAFREAVTFAGRYLDRLIVRVTAEHRANELVRAAMVLPRENSSLFILNQGMPWQKVVIEEDMEAELVVLPGNPGSGEWLVQAIPLKFGQQQPFRRRLPVSWSGLSGQALVEETGIPDAKFCHNSGHIAVASSREGALALAKLSLEDDMTVRMPRHRRR